MTDVPIQPVLIRNNPPFLPKEDRWYFPRKEISRFRMEFWEPVMPPEKGEEKKFAMELEQRFRKALGI
jgi:1-acyl-sn-glycerol-3-phosphate acyltransferase